MGQQVSLTHTVLLGNFTVPVPIVPHESDVIKQQTGLMLIWQDTVFIVPMDG